MSDTMTMAQPLTEIAIAKKLEIIIKPGKLDAVKKALAAAGYSGMTLSQAEGHGSQKGMLQSRDGSSIKMDLLPKLRMEIVVAAADLEKLLDAIMKAAQTGQPGDGKIFISDVAEIVRIRTGERGAVAI